VPKSSEKTPDLVLVTGGAGFIGSHLCEALLQQGRRVLCVDNFCDFYAPATKERNIADCLQHPEFSLEKADIRDPEALKRIFERYQVSAVIHLAAMAGVRPSLSDPELYTQVNIMGTLNLLELCRQYGIRHFVFASSSSVYGNNSKLPFAEDDPVNEPISVYAATKKAGELLCYSYHHLYQISVVALRFFTVYGPRQRPDLAIHKFAALMRDGKELPIFGDGAHSRDYTYIQDTIQGVLSALEYVKKGCVYEVINLGNDRSVTLFELIEALEEVTGIKAKLQWYEDQAGDVMHTRACVTKAHQLLNYRPSFDFREGLQLFWKWFTKGE
jgi:UDP-glucuronate 4-epimerase